MTAARLIATLIATAALTAIASPAAATETPEFVTVGWTVDNPADIWSPAQHTPVAVAGSAVDFEAVKALLPCGRYYQIDGYHAGDTTNALIAGGVLYGPNNPVEDLAHNAPGTEATGGVPWIYYTAPDCSETVCTGEFEQTTTTFNYVWDGAASARTDVAAISATLTEADAIAAGCYVPPVVDPLPPVEPTVVAGVTHLAEAGPDDLWLLIPAAALTALGVLLLVRVTQKRKYL